MHIDTEKGFGSDNFSGVLPEVMEALAAANVGHVHAYGDDDFTRQAKEDIKAVFGSKADTYFVFNGTGANTLSLAICTRSFEAVICAETAHIAVDECGAIERNVGCRLYTIPTPDGKLTPSLIEPIILANRNDQHHSNPRVVSISQSTELGTIYTTQEIRALADCAHGYGLLLHMDGARLANAIAALDCSPAAVTSEAGVDILSFGGTKNGMMIGEAVVILNPWLSKDAPFHRKQLTQLSSKQRFIAAQFSAILREQLWLRVASHANAMAQRMSSEVSRLPGVQVVYPTQANAIFVQMPHELIEPLQQTCFFYVWDLHQSVVRWVCSYDTTEDEVNHFVSSLKQLLASH